MAELLIRSKDNTHLDPVKDQRGSYKRGDIIVVMPDGVIWGRMESRAVWLSEGRDATDWPGGFVIVKIPGLSVEKAKDFLAPQLDPAGGATPELRRRLWRVVWGDLPASIKAALQADAEITVTPTQIKTYLRNKVNETQADI